MSRLIFLLEEPSMQSFLEGVLPRFFPGLEFLCIPHRGKQDLEKSIPRKLQKWRVPGDRFVILRDQDSDDCVHLKARLTELCRASGRPDAVVRIACRELEAWYLGDPAALAAEYGDESLLELARKKRFRDPDSVVHPAQELVRIVPDFRKIDGARRMAQQVTRDRNRSRSFQVLMQSVEKLAG